MKTIRNTHNKDTRVLDELITWANDGKNLTGKAFLTGGAGSGKTYTIKKLVSHLQEDYTLCATTHQAVSLLTEEGLRCSTIHSLLGSSVIKDINNINGENVPMIVLNTDEKNLEEKHNLLGMLIIDEASMLNDPDVKILIKDYPGKILFVGDLNQLTITGGDDIAPVSLNELYRFELYGSNRANNSDMILMNRRLEDLMETKPKGKEVIESVQDIITYKSLTVEELYKDEHKQYLAYTNKKVLKVSDYILARSAKDAGKITKVVMYSMPSYYVARQSEYIDGRYIKSSDREYDVYKEVFASFIANFKPYINEFESKKIITKYDGFRGQAPIIFSLEEVLYSVYMGHSKIGYTNTLIGDCMVKDAISTKHLTYEEFVNNIITNKPIYIKGTFKESYPIRKEGWIEINGTFDMLTYCQIFISRMRDYVHRGGLSFYPSGWYDPKTYRDIVQRVNKTLDKYPWFKRLEYFNPIVRYSVEYKGFYLDMFEDILIRKKHLSYKSDHAIANYSSMRLKLTKMILDKVLGIKDKEFKAIKNPVHVAIKILDALHDLTLSSKAISFHRLSSGLSSAFKIWQGANGIRSSFITLPGNGYILVGKAIEDYVPVLEKHRGRDYDVYKGLSYALTSLNNICYRYESLPYIRSAQARTIHKAQGKSYKEVYFDPYKASAKLVYVGLTRAEEAAYITEEVL